MSKQYLICHLSNGTDIGNKGIFYMSREVANRELTYGNYIFVDFPYYKAVRGITPFDNKRQMFSKTISHLWKSIVAYFTNRATINNMIGNVEWQDS